MHNPLPTIELPKIGSVSRSFSVGCKFGEGICAGSNGELFQVSIPDAKVFRLIPADGSVEENFSLHGSLSSIGGVAWMRGSFWVASSQGLIELRGKESVNHGLPEELATFFESQDSSFRKRFNDIKIGPDGKVYVGVIFDTSEARKDNPGLASFYSFDPESRQFKEVISGLTTPNGGVWDKVTSSSAIFYLNDTPTNLLKVYNHNLESGEFTHIRDIDLTAEARKQNLKTWGRPDGMDIGVLSPIGFEDPKTVIVIAMFSGGKIIYYTPDDDQIIGVSAIEGVTNTTSVCLVGSKAYVTSGKVDGESLSGNTFEIDLSKIGIVKS